MSVIDRVLSSVKDLIVMREQLDRLVADMSVSNSVLRDHENRLIRIETIIEMSRSTQTRLPQQ